VRRIHHDHRAQIANLRHNIRRDSLAVFDAYAAGAPPRRRQSAPSDSRTFCGAVTDGLNHQLEYLAALRRCLSKLMSLELIVPEKDGMCLF
jgi:hypothetical protein